MQDCIFCKICAGEIPSQQVYSDEQIIVFKDIAPKAPVHLLVVPKKHIQSLAHLEETDQALIAHLTLKLQQIAKQNGLTGGFRTIINTGDDGGQEVPHLHYHILGGGGPLPF